MAKEQELRSYHFLTLHGIIRYHNIIEKYKKKQSFMQETHDLSQIRIVIPYSHLTIGVCFTDTQYR